MKSKGVTGMFGTWASLSCNIICINLRYFSHMYHTVLIARSRFFEFSLDIHQFRGPLNPKIYLSENVCLFEASSRVQITEPILTEFVFNVYFRYTFNICRKNTDCSRCSGEPVISSYLWKTTNRSFICDRDKSNSNFDLF